MRRSIYSPENYWLDSPLYRFWRALHQFVARFFPPDWIYLVWCRELGGEVRWVSGVYLYYEDAKEEVERFEESIPGREADLERRPLRGG